MIRVFWFAVRLAARICDPASVRARWAATRGWMLLGAVALCLALGALLTMPGGSAHAGIGLEQRKLPMKFSWVACQPNCRGWVSAVGIVTADSPRDFDEFARPTTRRRDDCAGFQRRFGQRFDRARTALTPRGADYRRHQRPDQYRAGRFCQYCSLGVLRIDVRVPASYLARRIT